MTQLMFQNPELPDIPELLDALDQASSLLTDGDEEFIQFLRRNQDKEQEPPLGYGPLEDLTPLDPDQEWAVDWRFELGKVWHVGSEVVAEAFAPFYDQASLIMPDGEDPAEGRDAFRMRLIGLDAGEQGMPLLFGGSAIYIKRFFEAYNRQLRPRLRALKDLADVQAKMAGDKELSAWESDRLEKRLEKATELAAAVTAGELFAVMSFKLGDYPNKKWKKQVYTIHPRIHRWINAESLESVLR